MNSLNNKWSFKAVLVALQATVDSILEEEKTGKADFKYPAYYVGGTLCIDFKYKPSVGLNRNGRGFFYSFKGDATIKEVRFVMTSAMKAKVELIYLLSNRSKNRSKK